MKKVLSVVACRRVIGQTLLPDSVISDCHLCGAPIQVTPWGLERQRHFGAVVACHPCALQLVKDAEEQNKFGGAVTNPADLADMPDPKSMMPDSAELLEKAKAKPRPFSATSGNFAVVLASSGQPNTECNLDVAWGSYPPSDLDLKELEAWVQAELLPGSKIKERHFDE